jgi:hypothetical protein
MSAFNPLAVSVSQLPRINIELELLQADAVADRPLADYAHVGIERHHVDLTFRLLVWKTSA